MNFITIDDVPIFETWEKLNEDMRHALHAYLEEVKKVHKGEKSFNDIQSKHDIYIEKLNIWRQYFHEHKHILSIGGQCQ